MISTYRTKGRGRFIIVYALLAVVFIAGFQGYWLYSVYQSREKLVLQESENYLKEYALGYDGVALAGKIQSNQSLLPQDLTDQIINAAKANIDVQVKVMGPDNTPASDSLAKKTIDSLFTAALGVDVDKQLYDELKSNIALKHPNLKFGVKSVHNDKIISYPKSLKAAPANKALKLTSQLNPSQSYTMVLYNLNEVILNDMIWPMALSVLYLLVCSSAMILLINSINKSRSLMEMKDNFTNNITHEIKTPLSSLYAATEALDKFNMLDDKDAARTYVQLMQKDIRRLIGMAESILYNSKLTEGKVHLNLQPVLFKNLLINVVAGFKPRLDNESAIINMENVPDDLFVTADEEHLANVFANLIDNSLKYTRGNASITIEAAPAGKMAVIVFKDNGMGIAVANHRDIFRPYFRVTEGDRHDVKGYGLGLSYAREIVELHKGNIKVVQSEEGKGTMFQIIIPALDE